MRQSPAPPEDLPGGPRSGALPLTRAGIDGSAVVVAELDMGTARVTLHGVDRDGTLEVAQASTGGTADGAVVVGTGFELDTDVGFDSADVCLPYLADEVVAAGLREAELRLFHGLPDGTFEDVTTSVDTDADTICGSVTSFSPFAIGAATLTRAAGGDRIETAARISSTSFPAGVPVAYVATAGSFPDALAGGPAASVTGGPVLLTGGDALPAATEAELRRLRPGRIVVLGGPTVVPASIEDALRGLTDGEVTRLAGGDRFETAAAISAATFPAGAPVAYLATGATFPDALAGGAAAASQGGPVLLTGADRLPEATAAELARLRPARVVVLGGSSAVSADVEAQVAALTGAAVTRIAGSDRFATAAAVASAAFPTAATAYVATGENFPDALAGVPAAAGVDAPLLLIARDAIPAAAAEQLARLRPRRVVVLGGPAAVDPTTEATLTPAAPTAPTWPALQ